MAASAITVYGESEVEGDPMFAAVFPDGEVLGHEQLTLPLKFALMQERDVLVGPYPGEYRSVSPVDPETIRGVAAEIDGVRSLRVSGSTDVEDVLTADDGESIVY